MHRFHFSKQDSTQNLLQSGKANVGNNLMDQRSRLKKLQKLNMRYQLERTDDTSPDN